MKFWVYSVGRTGSVRLVKMITPENHQHYGSIKVSFMNTKSEHFVYHVHDTSITPPEDTVKILSTRRNTKNTVLSHFIARKTGAWQPITQQGIELSPFSVDEEEYRKEYYRIIKLEQDYIDKYNPLIIYLEDSVEEIEAKISGKLGKPFVLPYREQNAQWISRFPPKQYIKNYNELPQPLPKQVP